MTHELVPGQLDVFHQQPPGPVDSDPEPQPSVPLHRCARCGRVGDDVMYGLCRLCFDETETAA